MPPVTQTLPQPADLLRNAWRLDVALEALRQIALGGPGADTIARSVLHVIDQPSLNATQETSQCLPAAS